MTGDAPQPARGQLARAAQRWQQPAKWVLGSLLVLDLGVLLFALALANVTAEGPAKRALRHSVAVLTEVDAYLAEHFEPLQLQAAETEEELAAPDFPLAVTFTAEEVRDSDQAAFRAVLLDRSAAVLYEEGMAAFRDDRANEVSFFSPQGAVRTSVDFLRPGPHRVLTALTIALAAAAGVLAFGLVLATRNYGRLVALGLASFLAGLPFLVLVVAVRFAFRLTADSVDDYLAREFLELGQELTWAPIRNGIVFAVGSAVFLVAGAALARWTDGHQPEANALSTQPTL